MRLAASMSPCQAECSTISTNSACDRCDSASSSSRSSQRRPAGQTKFARERELNVPQSRVDGRREKRGRKPPARMRIARAQRLQPVFGFLLQTFECGIGSERAAHQKPSFRVAWCPLRQAGRRFERIRPFRLGGKSLAADRRRPRARCRKDYDCRLAPSIRDSVRQIDPDRNVVRRFLPIAHMLVDAARDQPVGGARRQQQVIDADAVILLPGAGLIIPERIKARVVA